METKRINMEFRPATPSPEEIRKARIELLPAKIILELSEFFRENGFKQEQMTDDIRATVQAAIRKALKDPKLNFIAGYMRDDIMFWIFDGFCMAGGRILLPDKPENAEFFNMLAGALSRFSVFSLQSSA